MASATHFCRTSRWMVFSAVFIAFAGTGLAAVSEFRVNTYTINSQNGPSVSMNDEGNFVVAWDSDGQDGSFNGVYAQRYDRRGNPVGSEFRVNTRTDQSQQHPSVSMNATGNFVIAWESRGQDGSSTGIYARCYDPNGNPLGGEFKVNTFTAEAQNAPSVSMNTSGNFVIAWESNGQDGSYGIYAQRYDPNGAPVGDEFQVNTHTAADQGSPAVGLDAAGNFIIAWTSGEQDGSSDGIYAKRYNPNGTSVGGEFPVNTTTVNSQRNPSISMNTAGNFVIVWSGFGQDGDGDGIFAQRYDPNGNPAGGEFRVNTHTADSQALPSVALNTAGNFVIAWKSSLQDTSFDGIYAQRYGLNGNPVGGEFRVNTHTTGFQTRPSVSMDAAGNFVIAWESSGQDGSFDGVYAQRFDPNGNPVGSEAPVNAYITSWQADPSAAMDAAGNFVIVWESAGQDGDLLGVFARRYDRRGNPLGIEFQINTYVAGSQDDPAVAMDREGNFVVAWESFGQDGDDDGIFARRYDRNGNPLGLEFQVNTHFAGNQDDPAVAMDREGNFVVVWDSFGQDGDGDGIFARRYDRNGNPLGVEFQINTYFAGHQDTPSVAMDGEGNFVIVWESFGQDGDGDGIYARRYDRNGNALGPEFQVNTLTAGHQDDPSVAMDREGNFVVVWEGFGQDGDGDGIYARRYDRNGNPLGIELQVNTYFVSNQDAPSVVMDGEGNFVIAWESNLQDGSGNGVYARHYDRDGNPAGGEFRINTYSDGDQGTPALAMAPHGQWAIAWESFGQDGSDYGIFMKSFIKDFSIYLPIIIN